MSDPKPSDVIRKNNPIDAYLLSKGVRLIGSGKERKCVCPFHKDKNPSMGVNVESGVWTCHAGCGGGSVIDLMARFENTTVAEILKRELRKDPAPQKQQWQPKGEIERIYPYTDDLGNEVYQVVRMKPKDFRQRHMGPDGKWIWNMEGVQRVLYHLPDVLLASEVWVVEGEKDADTLGELGIVATCNVGGAGKWLDGYTDSLTGKDVVICGDNDDAGRAHVLLVRDSLAGKVKSTRVVKVPDPHKDASDYIKAVGPITAKEELTKQSLTVPRLFKGVDVPVFSMKELEPLYIEHAKNMGKTSLNLSGWLPSLQSTVRSILPGEVIAFVADTGTGKTALLSNLAIHCAPLTVLFFELELPATLLFERIMAARVKWQCKYIEEGYRQGDTVPDEWFQRVEHIYACTKSRLTITELEKIIINSELKIGHRPQVVMLDYIQLIQGDGGSRYERMSTIAEDLKVLAKQTNTVLVVASQVKRKGSESGPEIFLHDAKDSGSIENSAGLVVGAWRDSDDKTTLWLRILKNTKGAAGDQIECNFDGASMVITEKAKRTP
jgi:5S rRNA maturation endonuclease (ribonuclease M5)